METPKLSETEEKALELLANHRFMMSAIEKVFLSRIPKDFNLSKDNQDLGADLRANITANKLLKEGFDEINRYGKKKQDKVERSNLAV